MTTTPTPDCIWGYTSAQVSALVSDLGDFHSWMRGQTDAICDGRYFDYDERTTKPSGCGPHGPVYYADDVQRYLSGGAS